MAMRPRRGVSGCVLGTAPRGQENFGPFGPIFAMDQPASSAITRDTLGWQPTHPSLLEDLEHIHP